MEIKKIKTPIDENIISELKPGDRILITGTIFTGRDAAIPKLCKLIENDEIIKLNFDIKGGVIFHTAVSPAGIGPTSSNKLEIEGNIEMLSKAGIKIHLGKGKLKAETVKMLKENNSVFAILPPVTALFESKTLSKEVVAFPELGMEAMHKLE
ncbi:MAG: fumarate hydratase C-terminal domain-containing protein, partial [Anaerovoracaceae bacterium]